MDILFFRGLRRILQKPSTFIDRAWMHERLFRAANSLTQNNPASRKYISFGLYYRQRRRKLWAHRLRAPPTNLCRLAILTPESLDLCNRRQKKRVGGPRYTWFDDSLTEAWQQFSPEAFEYERAYHTLLDLAQRRAPPPSRNYCRNAAGR